MREKIRLSDLTVLYICLSDNWGTLERRCIADASYFRNIGGTAFLLCHEKSLVDREAEREDIPRLHFSSNLKTWRSKLNFYFQLQRCAKKRERKTKRKLEKKNKYTNESKDPLACMLY